jgi:hypothetical protein
LLGTLSVQNFILTVEKKTTNIIPVKNQFIISFLNNSIVFEIEISFFSKNISNYKETQAFQMSGDGWSQTDLLFFIFSRILHYDCIMGRK